MEDVVVESEEAFTCTFGFRGENHVGNQIIGEAEPRDLSAAAVEALHETFEKKGVESTLIKLEEELLPPPAAGKPWPKARVLVVTQKGVKKLLRKLSDRHPTAIVSGRSVEKLQDEDRR